MDALLKPWADAFGSEPKVLLAGQDLIARYAEPHRHYHDLRHLSEVLQALQVLSDGEVLPAPVLGAAYWHDAVYDPTAPDNEARSAVLAGTTMRELGRPLAELAEIERLVLLTATHDPAPDDASGAVLSDADLAILAALPDRYRAYAADVREEYGHLDDETFRAGRAAVLRTLVDQPQLFRTAQGRRWWEAPARQNLLEELAGLGAGPPP